MRKVWKCPLIWVAIVTIGTGCSQPTSDVRIGYVEHISQLEFFVAQEKGFFKAEGLSIEPVKLGLREYMEALLTGRVDMLPGNTFPSIFGVEVESPGQVKFFLPTFEKKDGPPVYGIIALRKSSATSLQDLARKMVGATSPLDAINLELILKAVGLTPPRNPTILQLDRNVALPSLLSGSIDALALSQPDLAIALANSDVVAVALNPRAQFISDPYYTGASVITSRYLTTHKAEVLRIIRAMDRAISFISSNPQEALSILPQYVAINPSIATKIGYYLRYRSDESINLSKIQMQADFMTRIGLLKGAVNVQKMYIDKTVLGVN